MLGRRTPLYAAAVQDNTEVLERRESREEDRQIARGEQGTETERERQERRGDRRGERERALFNEVLWLGLSRPSR